MPDAAVAITPDALLGDLLERWPALEATLVEISPHFRALRNPVLRRTVAKVATLRQVAKVSGVPLGTLIDRLRAATGQGGPPGCPDDAQPAGADAAPRPAWAASRHATRTHDARAAIDAGEHPMQRVMQDLASLGDGGVYELVTPFVPAPLVDLARGKGFLAYSAVEDENLVRTWFRRDDAPAAGR